jgi:hypothetical protein
MTSTFKTLISKAALTSVMSMTIGSLQAQTKDPGPAPGTLGKVSFVYRDKKVTLTTVRGKDGNIWLQQNLGSTEVAQTLKDPQSYGDLFQWGRWDDGHQVRQPVNSSRKQLEPNDPSGLKATGSNPFLYDGIYAWWLQGNSDDQWQAPTPAQATATDGCDPCKALGAGWHLPTIEEWRTILEAEAITDGSSDMSSNLKLPFAGDRPFNGVLVEGEKLGGYYWSSTTNSQGGTAKLMTFYLEGFSTKQAAYRGNGSSVRCLKSASK